MEVNWVETTEQQFIVLLTTAVVPFDEPEAGVMADLVMIIHMDFFRETIRKNFNNKLRRPTHGKRYLLWKQYQDERSHQHRHHMQTQVSTQVHTHVEETEELTKTLKQQVELKRRRSFD